MMSPYIIKYLIDLTAVLLLSLGIKGLSKVRTARQANRLAGIAIALAIFGLFLDSYLSSNLSIKSLVWIISGATIGGLLGLLTA